MKRRMSEKSIRDLHEFVVGNEGIAPDIRKVCTELLTERTRREKAEAYIEGLQEVVGKLVDDELIKARQAWQDTKTGDNE